MLRRTLVPLLLLTLCPPFALVLWHTHTALGGSLTALIETGFPRQLPWFGSPTAWSILCAFWALQLLIMRVVPGRRFVGPLTPGGHEPVYKANGVAAFTLTQALFWLLPFDKTIIYDNFGPLLGALNVTALAFCLVLYFKGRYWPSGPDHGTSGNPVFDYYWGTELYPRILGWDVKMFTNCRFGMMGWSLIIQSFAAKQAALHGLSTGMMVAVGLQLVYIAKFFWWETGYLRSLDIMHDRAGFYICWGCLVWVPSVYTQSTLYLVDHPVNWSMPVALAAFAVGCAFIFMNYFADAERQRVRATGGNTKVWGKAPILIVGHYTTTKGEAKESLLLASGFWGIARHFHYVPEILGAAMWTLPVLFSNVLPWFYVIFLTILLTDRAFRDDKRCAEKYGEDWRTYCERVPYKIIPRLI